MSRTPTSALPIFGQDQHSFEHFIATNHRLFWGFTSNKFPNIGNTTVSCDLSVTFNALIRSRARCQNEKNSNTFIFYLLL